MYSLWYLLLFLVKVVLSTNRPIIGILAQEIELDDPNKALNYTSYIAASYVKAVEAAGARVVPVFIRRDPQYYADLATKVNGFLFTGGGSDIMSHNGVARSGKFVYDLVLQRNSDGVNIPIFGVCLGFELLATLSNDWKPILKDCDVEKEALNLKMVPGFRNSSLYEDASDDDIITLTTLPSTSNHHGHCLTQKNLTKFNLPQWRVLSTSVSKKGYHFISSMEWNDVPIAGVQFHPEKLAYEWKPREANPHDAKSIKAARLFYDWLVTQARNNNNSFLDSSEEQDHLIYNYSPIYTGKQEGYDTQDYYFVDPPDIIENSVY